MSDAFSFNTGAITSILALYESRGHERYDEAVSQVAHALQCADLADREAAPRPLVAAALLHDIGHLLMGEHGGDTDRRHERVGAAALGRWFGTEVTGPIRLHVAAKRYLCAVEDDYEARLSAASIDSLRMQGGPMSPAERAAFEADPHARDAIRLRRWDDRAKVPGVGTSALDARRSLLRSVLQPTD